MKSIRQNLASLAVAALSILGAGCGENFQGTFTGEGFLTTSTCAYSDSGRGYNIEVVAQISGNSARITLLSMVDKTTGSRFVNSYEYIKTPYKVELESDQDFFVRDGGYRDSNDAIYNVSGRINTSRDTIENLSITSQFNGTNTASGTTQQCFVELKAQNLAIRR